MIGQALTYSTDIEPGPAVGREGVAFVADTLTVLASLSPSGSLACHALIQGETIDGELTDDVIGTCELIVLAGYPQMSVEWLEAKQDLIAPGAIVIDTVGVKRVICDHCFAIAERHDWTFVGCHPMAGTQFSGFAHSRANMFHNAPMVVVPPLVMDDFDRVDVLERLKKLLAPCEFGSFTLATPEFHDEQIAFTSQLAHVVSNAYVKSPTAREHHGFSAGS